MPCGGGLLTNSPSRREEGIPVWGAVMCLPRSHMAGWQRLWVAALPDVPPETGVVSVERMFARGKKPERVSSAGTKYSSHC